MLGRVPNLISERPLQGGLSFREDHFTDVRYWHLADIPMRPLYVRYLGVKRTSFGRTPMAAIDP
jgi:hypothetical protein